MSASAFQIPEHQKSLEAIRYDGQSLQLLDQRVLPHTVHYDDVKTTQDTFDAIATMRVRGAPAIAVTAALGVSIDARAAAPGTAAEGSAYLVAQLDHVAKSRPTAVNLFNAIEELKVVVTAAAAKDCATGATVVAAYVAAAEAMMRDDIAYNENIMKKGAQYLSDHCSRAGENLNIVTICNTGALATSRYGTALGVVRGLHYAGRLNRVFPLETRPWNQGARLTVFECVHEAMPTTLIVDSAVSSLMRQKKIDAVIVGADRICVNGDTANKIGTYNLAVAAKHHGVPFFVAAPTTTLDLKTQSGESVPIEERDTMEITHNMASKQRVVAEGATLDIWNPVFDITPGELITGGIITEKGVVPPAKSAPYFNTVDIVQ